MQGQVKWFNDQKGYGFIAPDQGGKDVFIHISALQDSHINTLTEGQRISFDLGMGRNGKESAINIKAA